MKFPIAPIVLVAAASGLFCACGVKGKPQPPLTPPTLGRGEPTYPDATQDLMLKKKTPIKIEGDFDEPKDFSGDKE